MSERRTRLIRALRIVLALIVTIGLTTYLLSYVSLKQSIQIAKDVPPRFLVGAFTLYLVFNCLRALRYRVLLGLSEARFTPLLSITLFHNFLTRTLPFMMGELSYVILVRRYLDASSSQGISSLFGARLLEALFVSLSALIGLYTIETSDSSATLRTVVIVILGVGVLSIAMAGPILEKTLVPLLRILQHKMERPLVERFLAKAQDLAGQLRSFRQPRTVAPAIGLSVLTYLTSFGFYVVLLRGCGIDHSLGVLMVVVSISIASLWFPFAFSGIGVVEGGWVLGLTQFAEVDAGKAIALAFFLHGALIVSTAATGLAGLLVLSLLSRKRREPPGQSQVNAGA